MRRNLDRRARLLALLFLGAGVALATRLFILQVPRRAHYLALEPLILPGLEQETPRPGSIYARNGQELAVSVLGRSVCANPSALKHLTSEEREHVAGKVAQALSLQKGLVLARLSRPDSSFAFLKRCAKPGEVDRVLGMGIEGVYTRSEYRRMYPEGRFAANVIGARGTDCEGLEGIEREWASLLDGAPGAAGGEPDLAGFPSDPPGVPVLPPEPGKSLTLTLSVPLQQAAEAALDRLVSVNHPVRTMCVVYDPRSGEILAMACRPTFDPNDISKVAQEQFRCLPVTQPFEPGSTWKPVTVAAALDAGAITPGSVFRCGGTETMGGEPLRCWGPWAQRGHGALTPEGVLSQSCNLGAAKIAVRIGRRRMGAYLDALRVNQRLGSGLPGEQPGSFRPARRMYMRDLANIGFGQGIRVTALHMVAGYGAICNEGVLLQPNIIRDVCNPDGTVLRRREPQTLGRVFSPEACRQALAMLEQVVQSGTGRPAGIKGVRVGGKTGTAQIWDPKTKRYLAGQYLLSFCAVAPIEDPRFVVLVTVERPRVGEHGSDTAAPAAREVLLAALREEGLVTPDRAAPLPRPRPANASSPQRSP